MTAHELLPANASAVDFEIFRAALTALVGSEIPFAVGGAIAVRAYSGVWRETHDLDVFTQPEHAQSILRILESTGLRLSGQDPKWLYVTKSGETQVDVVFAFRNEVQQIDDLWIKRSRPVIVASVPVLVSSPEDTIYSKTFILNRERFDWGDCINIIVGLKGNLDWDFLKWRLRDYPSLFLAELFFCLQVYPESREWIPEKLLSELFLAGTTQSANIEDQRTEWFFSRQIVPRVNHVQVNE